MKFQDLKKSLSNLMPVYYIYGDDAFLRQKAVEMIEARAVKFRDLNVIRFDDENTDINNIVIACRALPMMDEHRVVVCKDLSVKKQEEIKPLVDYTKSPTSTTILIVVDSAGAGVYKKFIENATSVDCSKLDVNLLGRLVLNELTHYACKINSDALSTLIEYCNLDYTRINNEIIKLASLVGSGGTITLDDVVKNVSREIDYDIFELSNAVSRRDGRTAVAIVKNLLEKKESPQKLLMLIQSNFRRMFYAINTKESTTEIANKLGVKEYAVRKSKEQATKFAPARLKKILDLGASLDYQIKAGQMTDENAILYFVANICV